MRPLLVLASLLVCATASALPVELTHSGYLLAANDAPLDGPVPMKFAIYDGSGARVWASAPAALDPACVVTVKAGYYAVTLGAGCGTGLTTNELPPGAPRFLQVVVDGVDLSPRQAITTAPAAAMALALPAGAVTGAMLANTTVAAGTYTNATVAVDAQGRLTAASSGAAPVTSVVGGGGLSASVTGGVATVGLPATLGAGGAGITWNGAPIADAYVSGAAGWNGKVAGVTAGTGITITGTATNPTISVSGGAGGGTYSTGLQTLAGGAFLDVPHNFATNDVTVQLWRTADAGASWELVVPVPAVTATDVYGSGADGALTATSADHRIDTVRGTVNAGGGGVTATVTMASGAFAAFDLVLLMQMQGTGANAGHYEEAVVANVAGNVLTFAAPLTWSYTHGTGTNTAQILRIPQYTSVTVPDGKALRPTPWDGATGGILAFKANGTLNLATTGSLDASGRGFRGGATGGSSDTNPTTRPSYGESYTGPAAAGVTANGGGGSGGIAGNGEGMAGGFGASYGTAGTVGIHALNTGSAQGAVGATYGVANLSAMVPGSGGGGGSNHYWGGQNPQLVQPNGFGSGGAGGGVVYVAARTTQQTGGQVLADGTNGQTGYVRAITVNDIGGGGGGGGSGGSIYFVSSNANGTFYARGGSGGTASATSYGGWNLTPVGGNGGAGRIRIDGTGTITSNPTHQAGSPPAAPVATGLSIKQTSANVVRVTNTSSGSYGVRVVVQK